MIIIFIQAIFTSVIYLFDTSKLNNYYFFLNPNASKIDHDYSIASNWGTMNSIVTEITQTELNIRFNPYPLLTFVFRILDANFISVILFHLCLNIFIAYLFVKVVKKINLPRALAYSSVALMSFIQISYIIFGLGLNTSILANSSFVRLVDHFKFMTGAADWYASSIGLEPRNSIAILSSVLLISFGSKVSKFYFFFVIIVHPVSYLILISYLFLGSVITLNFDRERIKILISSVLFFLGVTNLYYYDYSLPLFFEIILIVTAVLFFKTDYSLNDQNSVSQLSPSLLPVLFIPIIYVIYFDILNSTLFNEIYQRTIFISRFIFYYGILHLIIRSIFYLRNRYFRKNLQIHYKLRPKI
jgi:hypothetical protein